jgi:hypothetical protein
MGALETVTLLLALIEELRATIERENRLLRSMDVDALGDVLEHKTALADAYEVELRRLRARPELVAELPPAVRSRLEQALRDLQASMRANLNALLVAKGVVERMARHIAVSLSEAGAGCAFDPSRPRRAEVVPLALDRQV